MKFVFFNFRLVSVWCWWQAEVVDCSKLPLTWLVGGWRLPGPEVT